MTDELPTGMTLSLEIKTTQRGAQAKLEEIVSVLSDTWDVVITKKYFRELGDESCEVTVVLMHNPKKGEEL